MVKVLRGQLKWPGASDFTFIAWNIAFSTSLSRPIEPKSKRNSALRRTATLCIYRRGDMPKVGLNLLIFPPPHCCEEDVWPHCWHSNKECGGTDSIPLKKHPSLCGARPKLPPRGKNPSAAAFMVNLKPPQAWRKKPSSVLKAPLAFRTRVLQRFFWKR